MTRRNASLKIVYASVAALSLVSMSACASGPSPQEKAAARLEEKGEELEDAAVTAKVASAILEDKTLEDSDIHVETYNNVVRLHGFVMRNTDAERAEMIALGVRGVSRVKNDLYVR